jgi:hypothetical protein
MFLKVTIYPENLFIRFLYLMSKMEEYMGGNG